MLLPFKMSKEEIEKPHEPRSYIYTLPLFTGERLVNDWEKGFVLDSIPSTVQLGQFSMAVHLLDRLPQSVVLLSTEGSLAVCYDGRYLGTLSKEKGTWTWAKEKED